MTSLSASCNTLRRSKQLHLDPGKIAVMVASGSAAHPSNCTRLWCSKYPRKLKCVAQAQTTRRLARSNAFARDQSHSSSILCFCSSIKSLHFHQYFPHGLLGSFIRAVRGVPIHAILLPSLRHFWCSQGFPPTNQRRRKRNRPLTRDAQEFHNFSSRFFCQVQKNFWVESVASHSCFCLVQS